MRTLRPVQTTTENDGYTNLWPQKAVNWHLKMVGLSEDRRLDKYHFWCRFAMLVLVFICICQQLCGILIRFAEGTYTMAQIVIPFQFVLIISCTAVETYIFVYRAALSGECLQNSTEILHCLTYKDEATIRQKHMPLFKFLMMTFVAGIYAAALVIPILSPLFRFGFNLGSTTFVLYPLWYPIDVLSSRILFWTVFLYEALLWWFLVQTYNNKNVVFLYLVLMARVRLDALNQFVRDIVPFDVYRVASSNESNHDKNKVKSNNILLEKGDIPQQTPNSTEPDTSCASGRYFTIRSDDENEHLERLKKAVRDVHRLRRQTKRINDMFKIYFGSSHSVGFMSTTIMSFATINELRNSAETSKAASAEIFLYAFIAVVSLIQIYTVFLLTTLLQESYDSLRHSFWAIDWCTETAEFKRLFINTKAVLNQPLTMKAYSYYPINLRTFNSSMKESWRVILFLYQLTAPQ